MKKETRVPNRAFLAPGQREALYVTMGKPDRPLMTYFMTPRTAKEALPVFAAALMPVKPKRADRKVAAKAAKKMLKRLVKEKTLLKVDRFTVHQSVAAFKHVQVEALDFDVKDVPEAENGFSAVGKRGDTQVVARLNRDLLHAVQSHARYDLVGLIKITAKNRHLTFNEAAERLLGELPVLLGAQLVFLTPARK